MQKPLKILVNTFQKIHVQLEKSSYIKFIILCYLIIFIGYIIPAELIEFFFEIEPFIENPVIDKFSSKSTMLFLSVIIAPIIETLIFQILLIKGFFILFTLFFDSLSETKIDILAIIASSLVFGFGHYYSALYIFMMFILGLFFGMIYFYSK